MVKKVLMSKDNKNTGEKTVRVRRGRVDSVDLYEVKENELEMLEYGEATGIYLNFSIFLLSLAFSSILTLSTATFSNSLIQNSFLFISIIGILLGIILLILWWRGRRNINSVVEKIKGRINTDFVDFQKNEESSEQLTPVEDDQNIIPKG